jgi:HK97 family phage major capsid protein
MNIQVIERETQKLIDIEEAAYDKTLHARVTVEAEAEPEGGDNLDALRKDVLEGFKSLGAELKTTLTAGAGERGRIEVRGPSPEDGETDLYDETTIRAMGGGQMRGECSRQYLKLPAAQREIRSHQGDVMSAEWIRANARKDMERVREIESSAGFHGGYSRADQITTPGSPGTGDKLLPAPLANFIAVKRDSFERVQPNSMTVTSVSQTLDIPLELTTAPVEDIAEATAATEVATTYGELTLTKKKKGRLSLVSWELLVDQSASFSIVTMIGNETARKLAVAWDTEAADGSALGVGGTVDSSSLSGGSPAASVTWTDPADPTRAEIVELLLAVPTAWRDGGGVVCMGNSVVTGYLSKVVDLNDRPIYGMADIAAIPTSDVGNANGLVEGVPYLEVPFGANIMMFGNLAAGHAVLMDGGIRLDTSSDFAFNSDRVAVRVLERRSSGIMQAEAFAKSSALT